MKNAFMSLLCYTLFERSCDVKIGYKPSRRQNTVSRDTGLLKRLPE